MFLIINIFSSFAMDELTLLSFDKLRKWLNYFILKMNLEEEILKPRPKQPQTLGFKDFGGSFADSLLIYSIFKTALLVIRQITELLLHFTSPTLSVMFTYNKRRIKKKKVMYYFVCHMQKFLTLPVSLMTPAEIIFLPD